MVAGIASQPGFHMGCGAAEGPRVFPVNARSGPGTHAFGRFDPLPAVCETSLDGVALTAADYSLQLAASRGSRPLPARPSVAERDFGLQ